MIRKGSAQRYQPGDGGIINVEIKKAKPVIDINKVKFDLLILHIE